jgi:hypothetical protein
MRLLDRVRARLAPAPAEHAWNDGDVERVAVDVTALAGAWDPEPDDGRIARSRAMTLGAFAAAMADQAESRQGVAGRTPPPAGVAPVLRRGGRRPVLVLVAAGFLLVVSVGTVAASAPGGLLYGIRVASEELFLPGSPSDRARAQVERLDRRVTEATDAAAHGDAAAITAALRAYADIADEAAAGSPPDPPTAAALALRIRAQQALITSIDPGDAALGVVRERARVAAGALLGALGAPGGGPGPAPSAGGAPPAGSTAPQGTGTPGGPGATSGPADPGGSGPTGGPGSGPGSGPGASTGVPGPSASPAGSQGPKATAGSGGQASPKPSAAPRASGNPSTGPGGPIGTVTGSTGSPALDAAWMETPPDGRP